MGIFMHKPILEVLAGKSLAPPPVWFMRQAGRYLPEYKALRAVAGDFMGLCFNPDLAAEVTLQPVRRFGFDAAILFSDILVVPYAMGQQLWFEDGEGPRLAPAVQDQDLATLTPMPQRLLPIYETVRTVKAALPPATTLIGFCGSPWTVATYMVAGRGSKDQAAARLMAYAQPDKFRQLIDAIITTSIDYLRGQADAGAEVLMLFDSWAGVLPPDQLRHWVIHPNARLATALRQSHPHIPLIAFPRGASSCAAEFLAAVPVQGFGVDETVDLAGIRKIVPPQVALQGNLDPVILLAGGQPLVDHVRHIRDQMQGHPHIFNLGHGISQFTPPGHVALALATLREKTG
jgi:uroporphyrinogen decarboxylase